jgi:hypothetical protein
MFIDRKEQAIKIVITSHKNTKEAALPANPWASQTAVFRVRMSLAKPRQQVSPQDRLNISGTNALWLPKLLWSVTTDGGLLPNNPSRSLKPTLDPQLSGPTFGFRLDKLATTAAESFLRLVPPPPASLPRLLQNSRLSFVKTTSLAFRRAETCAAASSASARSAASISR